MFLELCLFILQIVRRYSDFDLLNNSLQVTFTLGI